MKKIVFTTSAVLFVLIVFIQGHNCSKTTDNLKSETEWSEELPALESETTYLHEFTPDQGQDVEELDGNASDKVLICKSKSAYAYHSHMCQGLKRCKAGTGTMTKKEAEKAGYKPCKNCY